MSDAIQASPFAPSKTTLVETVANWVRDHDRAVLSLGIGLQTLVLVVALVTRLMPHATGETILLRVVPVDPRDMFRGQYVALSYEFSRQLPSSIESSNFDNQHAGQTVYATLVLEDDGQHWRVDAVEFEPPASGLYLRGTIQSWSRVDYGIESFFVEEGRGPELEEAVRNRTVAASVSVGPDGTAALRDLVIE